MTFASRLDLPLLATCGVGSYASPGWMFPLRDAIRAGALGPADIDEAFADATRVVVGDQLDAGIDLLSDGELRRQRFVYEMYGRLTGLERIAAERRLGVPGYDMAPRFRATEAIGKTAELGLVAEYRLLRTLAGARPVKVALPGPMTFAMNIDAEPFYGEGARGRQRLVSDLAALIAREVDALRESGADVIQLDEPGFVHAADGEGLEYAAASVNAALGSNPRAVAVHVCFGNNASRPFAPRGMARLMSGLGALGCGQLVLEFANREMAEVELLASLARDFHIAAGVVDVKSFHVESVEAVIERARRVLAHVPAEQLWLTADCGFSAIPRWLALAKCKALAGAARRLRAELDAGVPA